MEDELARRRDKQPRADSVMDRLHQAVTLDKPLTGSALFQAMWEHLDEAITWTRGAEDAIETSDYACLVCGHDVGLDEHKPDCVGSIVRAARRSLEQAQSELVAKHPEAFG